MTPKEELKEIYNGMSNNVGFVKEFKNIEQALTELETLKRYPTSEEVCEVLSGYLKEEVIFKDGLFQYRKNNSYKIMTKENDYDYCINDLPLSLITLIGRFYEGVEKK